MGRAIQGVVQEAGDFYKNGDYKQSASKVMEAVQMLDVAVGQSSADFYDAIEPTIGRIEMAYAALGRQGMSLPEFERPLKPRGGGRQELYASAKRIDELVAMKQREHGVKPLPLATDEVFLRRVYLDLAGRIPTYAEANRFLKDCDMEKRANLVEDLLESPAYTSNFLNYWGDILRLRSRLTKNTDGLPYIDFVRKSLMSNKPYDEFVYELLTARGYIWENGAAGYYIRDKNMPLDHLAITGQIFLGTQLQCAQCHDHPYDDWTQKEFYQLAAFTYGIDTEKRQFHAKKLASFGKDRSERQAYYGLIKDYTTPVNTQTYFNEGLILNFPEDYQYNDAKPFETVVPETLFGDRVEAEPGTDSLAAFADWMTSEQNPRFAMVIANRLWKRAMGVGLFEPIDDITSHTKASNPALLEFLTKKMVEYEFNLKRYLQLIYNTQAYQRQSNDQEVDLADAYWYPGPLFRRMTAEEAWDSLITLIVPEPDSRYGDLQLPERHLFSSTLPGRSPEELIPAFREQKERRALQNQLEKEEHQMRRFEKGKSKLSAKQLAALEERIATLNRQIDETPGLGVFLEHSTVSEPDSLGLELAELRRAVQNDPLWKEYPSSLVRASELDVPAPPEHFLGQFGQSDRDLVENSSRDASVTQILTLLNGPYFEEALKPRSVLMTSLSKEKHAEEKIRVIYLSMLTREPTQSELALCRAEIRENGEEAYADIVWALLNTRQFIFVN